MKKKLLRNFALGASDAIHFDDPSGSAVFFQGGCFCVECIRLFREFVKTRYTTQQLADWGVEDVDRFDYRELVRTVAPDRQAFVERYRNARRSIPLMTVYEDFQNESWTRLFVQDVKHWAAKEVGRPIPLSANVVNFRTNYSRSYPLCDFFVAEIGHIDSRNYEWRGRKAGASTDVVVTAGSLPGPTAIMAHKLAEAMGRPLSATALPQDWRYLRERGAWDLLRLWIALAYANGHPFMVPFSQWVFTEGQQEKKPYAPPRGETVPLYRFRHVTIAYNEITLATHPDTGEQVHLIGRWANHPDRTRPDLRNSAWYLVRHADGAYFLGRVFDPDDSAVDPRYGLHGLPTICASPFPEDRGRVWYFGGFDQTGRMWGNQAWIYNATLQEKP